MISQLEKVVTLRFLKARKKDGFLNVISIFSFIGIALGVAVLIIVMSVMNGFRTELINKIVGLNAHITVDPYESAIEVTQINNNLQNISKNLIFSNSGEAIIIKSNTSKGILLRGYKGTVKSTHKVDPKYDNALTVGDEALIYANSFKYFVVNKVCTRRLKQEFAFGIAVSTEFWNAAGILKFNPF